MREPTDEQLNRLRVALTDLQAALLDATRATKRISKQSARASSVLLEISKYMEGDA